ncbi:biotin transporter BioY [Microbacterium sp. SORGH_AS_0888]|uniref:biotin transporter BioY n=1 Tax=Microbacterium sp. SORGH_AS_0888 TaxID=3041791 RepID=UPI002786C89B|nr:biotin transporter BioY [Microbacterium sp. SORGH_AS_0888]MDQ1128430.1 biotin transport system substrate-specific component [Microbacterium sp. SORGH_AS_0888]
MSSFASALPRRRVLADLIARPSSRALALAVDAGVVVAGTIFVALLAQVTIPLPIVPITGQTLAVLVVGASLGAVRAASALLLYAFVGVVGLPVFSEGASGPGVLFGSTGGFIVGFIVSAALVGWMSERQWDRRFVKALVTFVVGTVVTFAVGLPWLFVWFSAIGAETYTAWGYATALQGTIESGLLPFILPGVVKAVIAAALIPGAWALVRALDTRKGR